MSGVTLVDAHVHLYQGFDLSRAFSAAQRNLRSHVSSAVEGRVDACLCLTEDRYHDVFSTLENFESPDWTLMRHEDGRAIRAQATGEPTSRDGDASSNRSGELKLWLFAGRQIITSERLEVLALLVDPGEARRLVDGLSLPETVARVDACGGLAVLPWAFGKWWFSRGRLVSDFVRTCSSPLFLGDNGGRWQGLGGLLPEALAAESGRCVLPGSDPLPLTGQEDRIGRYGFSLAGAIDEDAPAASLCSKLQSLGRSPRPMGTKVSLAEFLLDQWRLRTARLPAQKSAL